MTVADHTPPHLADIAVPGDATHVGEWDDYDTDRWSRPFTGTGHHRAVTVVGVQHADGAVDRLVAVNIDGELSPTTARKLAAAITAAANEVAQLAHDELPVCAPPRDALIEAPPDE